MNNNETKKKIVYIIGPCRANTINGIFHNIANAYYWMEWCWKNGYTPVCPHTNSAFTCGLIPEEEIMAGCIEIMLRCDAVLLTDGWEESEGSIAEKGLAEGAGLELIDPYEVIIKGWGKNKTIGIVMYGPNLGAVVETEQ